MAKDTRSRRIEVSPTGALKPKGYTVLKWPALEPATRPIAEAEREVLGFYDKARAISIDRASGLFVYNFGTPPRIRRPPYPRRGIEPLRAPRSLVGVKLNNDSPVFWRPRLFVARMNYLRKTEEYNPDLKRDIRLRSTREKEAARREEFKSYLRLKKSEEGRKDMALKRGELIDYMNILNGRKKARQIEEEAGRVEMDRLLEEIKSITEETTDPSGADTGAGAEENGDTKTQKNAKTENKRLGATCSSGASNSENKKPKSDPLDDSETRKAMRKTKRTTKQKAKARKAKKPNDKSKKSFRGGLKEFFCLW